MRTYFEAYRADGSQVLGNLDGQGVTKAKNYQKTTWYKALRDGVRRPLWPKIAYWIVMQGGHPVEKIINIHAEQR